MQETDTYNSCKPVIAQLVEHLTVECCSNQMVPASIPGGRIFSFARSPRRAPPPPPPGPPVGGAPVGWGPEGGGPGGWDIKNNKVLLFPYVQTSGNSKT